MGKRFNLLEKHDKNYRKGLRVELNILVVRQGSVSMNTVYQENIAIRWGGNNGKWYHQESVNEIRAPYSQYF